MLRRWIAGLAVVTLALAGLAVAAPRALAVPSASVTLTVPNNRVTAGAAFAIRYSSSRLPTGTGLTVQRQVGTAHVWKPFVALRGLSGAATLPGGLMGIGTYRIRAWKGGALLATSSVKSVYFYGTVAMATICGIYQEDDGDCSTSTEAVGTTVFSYVIDAGDWSYPTYGTAIHYGPTTCRSASIYFANDDPTYQTGNSYVEFLQSTLDPQTAQTPLAAIGKLTATLDGGPWYLQISTDNGQGVDINGSFSCYTPTGM